LRVFYRMSNADKINLVDEKYSIGDLVDLEELRKIFESFSLATGFTIGFLEHPSLEILIATGWRDICTKFHRLCPESLNRCLESNTKLISQLKKAGQLVIEECENGLVDCATPIIIKGKHIATLATGQVLLEKPDIERFKKQAQAYGFDIEKYLVAMNEVLVVSPKKLKRVTSFLSEIAILIAELGLINLEIKEQSVNLEKAIDERKQFEDVLQERETFIRTVLDNLPVGIAVNSVDPSIQFEYMNDNFPKLYHTTREALSNKDAFWEAVYEDSAYREKIRKQVLEDCASGDPTRMHWNDVPITRQGEKTAFIDAQNISIPHRQLMISMVWDVTTRNHMEEALRASEEKFRHLFDQAADLIVILDLQGNFMDLNRIFEEESGWSRTEMIGKNVLTGGIVTEESSRHISFYLNQLIKGKEIPIFEIEGVRKDGGTVPYEIRATTIRKDGKTVAIQAILRNITERKQAIEAVETLRKQNLQILQSAGEGILGLDKEGKHMFINPSAAKILGYKPDELIGMYSHKTWHHTKLNGTLYPENECPIYESIKDGAVHTVTDEIFWKKDGTSFPVEYTTNPIQENGTIIGAVVTFKDVTERRQMEEEIQKRIADLEDFYSMAVGRELRMKELKEEMRELKEELEKYKSK